MIDALFWYTGLIVWVLIVLGIASMLAVGAHDRSGKSPIGKAPVGKPPIVTRG